MFPRSPSWILPLAIALAGCGAAGGRPEAASAESSAGQSAVELFAAGREATQRGDAVRAEQYLSLAIERGYDPRLALPLLLRACLSSLHLRTALDHAERYLADHPDDDRLRYLVATIDLGLSQEAEARSELEQLIRHNPRHADAHLLLGLIEKDREAAGEHFKRYLEISPDGRHAAEAREHLSELAVVSDSELKLNGRASRQGVPRSVLGPAKRNAHPLPRRAVRGDES